MLENNRLKPYFLQIDLENMILTAKNIKIVSLVDITSEFRTGPRFMLAQPCGQLQCPRPALDSLRWSAVPA